MLDRDDFTWAQHGEALLERHCPNWRPTPSVTGLMPEYAAAARRLRDAR